jgi:hypothetical protein
MHYARIFLPVIALTMLPHAWAIGGEADALMYVPNSTRRVGQLTGYVVR